MKRSLLSRRPCSLYDDLRAQIGDDLMDRWLATVPQS